MQQRFLPLVLFLSSCTIYPHQQHSASAAIVIAPPTDTVPVQRSLYATVYVFNPAGTDCLMIWHKRFGKWMPPGGKIDANEMPDDTALRECKEETGITIKLVGNTYQSPTTGNRIQPFGLEQYPSTPYLRATGYSQQEAYDFIFMAIAEQEQLFQPQPGESVRIRWVPLAEIAKEEFAAFPNVKLWSKFFAALHAQYRAKPIK